MSTGDEWEDMPRFPHETDDHYSARGPFYAILKRVPASNEFFERLERLRPRFMAVFGANADVVFKMVREARAIVIVSARMLTYREITGPNADTLRTRYEADVWEGLADVMLDETPEGDRVGSKIDKFVKHTEKLCRPIVDRSYGRRENWWARCCAKLPIVSKPKTAEPAG